MNRWPSPAFLRRWHRRLALVVGIQLVLWTASGLYFTLFAIERVRGEDHLLEPDTAALDLTSLLPANELHEMLLRQARPETTGVQLRSCARGLVYVVEHASGETTVLEARTGEPLAPLTEAEALQLAPQLYQGHPAATAATWVLEGSGEYRGDLPAWQVELRDGRSTTLYVDPWTGDCHAVRNRVWRVFDFLWSLHIMDYRERTDFHHPLLIAASILGLLTATTGTLLQVAILRGRYRRRPITRPT